jgi:hypothetical protein
MDEVFSGATKVVVWLGGDPEVPSDVLPEDDCSLNALLDLLGKPGSSSLPLPSRGDMEAIEREILLQKGGGSNLESIIALAKDCWPHEGRLRQRRMSTFAVDLYILILFTKMPRAGPVRSGILRRLLDPTSYVWQFYRIQVIEAALYRDTRHIVEALAPEIKAAQTQGALFLGRLGQLLSIPWFERVWVVQEVTGNANVSVWHGKNMLAWNMIVLCCDIYDALVSNRVIHMMGPEFITESPGLATAVPLAKFWGVMTSRKLSMCELLLASSSLKATVPRDMLYAVYRMAADSSKVSFEPDYVQSLQDTYTDFTRSMIEATRRLDIFSILPATGTHAPPSWVPQYHRLAFYKASPAPRNYYLDSSYSASGDRPACYIRPVRDGSLILQGVHLATIRCGVAFTTPQSLDDTWSALASAHYSLFDPRVTTDDSRRDAHLPFSMEALIGTSNSFSDIFALLDPDKPVSIRERLSKLLVPAIRLEHSPSVRLLHLRLKDLWALRRYNIPSGTQPMLRMLGEFWRQAPAGSKYFFTSDGGFGGSRGLVQDGDLIVALDGGSLPFVLRQRLPLSRDGGRAEAMKGGMEFQLVGTCYLHGEMDGEIFDSPRWRESDPLYADPMDYDPDFRTPGGVGYTRGFYRKRPFVIT